MWSFKIYGKWPQPQRHNMHICNADPLVWGCYTFKAYTLSSNLTGKLLPAAS